MRRAHPERALEKAVAEAVAASAGETLLAAVSGGPDSAALAALLAHHATECGARVVLAHVNHGTRSSAARDEAVVLSLASLLGVRALVRTLGPGERSEARLRGARYAQLVDSARESGARRVFTAHHAEDQTETVGRPLANLLKAPFVLLPGGHFLPLELPAEIAAQLLPFLA